MTLHAANVTASVTHVSLLWYNLLLLFRHVQYNSWCCYKTCPCSVIVDAPVNIVTGNFLIRVYFNPLGCKEIIFLMLKKPPEVFKSFFPKIVTHFCLQTIKGKTL